MDNPSSKPKPKRKPCKVSHEICDKCAAEAEELGLPLIAQMLRDMARKARQNGGHVEV